VALSGKLTTPAAIPGALTSLARNRKIYEILELIKLSRYSQNSFLMKKDA
jgi:hypothetical protein